MNEKLTGFIANKNAIPSIKKGFGNESSFLGLVVVGEEDWFSHFVALLLVGGLI
jgi:hypothetical protein